MSKPAPSPTLSKPRKPDPNSGVVLAGLTVSLICWFITGIAGYTSPSLPIDKDMTLLYVFLWLPQAAAGVLLGVGAVMKRWSTSGALWSAATVGFGMASVYGLCWGQWGNVATGAFWLATGVYVAVAVEMKYRVAESLERRIDVLLSS
jgi:hypothetical protein